MAAPALVGLCLLLTLMVYLCEEAMKESESPEEFAFYQRFRAVFVCVYVFCLASGLRICFLVWLTSTRLSG